MQDGALSHEVDSAAVQITADITGSRSINAMNAPSTLPTGADADIASIVQQTGIFTGFVGSTRPTLQTVVTPEPPSSLTDLENTPGAFSLAGSTQAGSETDLASFYAAAIASSVSPGFLASLGGSLAVALLLLNGAATGAFRTGDNLTAQTIAIKTYNTAKGP
jgi:hypothetical protein